MDLEKGSLVVAIPRLVFGKPSLVLPGAGLVQIVSHEGLGEPLLHVEEHVAFLAALCEGGAEAGAHRHPVGLPGTPAD